MDIENGEALELPLRGEESSLPPGWKPAENPEDDDEYLKEIPPWTIREIIVAGVASVSVLSSVLSIVVTLALNPFVIAMGILGLLIPPYCALQEQKITDCRALAQTNKVMEHEMNNLKYNNERLAKENDKLHESVKKLNDIEDTFADVKALENVSIASLEKQLKESKTTLSMMERNWINEVVDNVFEVMLAIDGNHDSILSDEEIHTLTLKLEGIENVEINDAVFKKHILNAGRNLDAIMTLLRGLLDDDPLTSPLEEGEQMFTFKKS